MRNIKTFEDVRLELVELRGVLDNLRVRSQDLHGLRMTNAGDAKDPGDYITLRQINDLVADVVPQTLPKIISAVTNNITNLIGAGNWIYYTLTLVSSITLPDSPDAMPGTFIAILIKQNGTGGYTLTWPSKYKGMGGSTATLTANTYQVALFYCIDPATSFQLLSPPISGVL